MDNRAKVEFRLMEAVSRALGVVVKFLGWLLGASIAVGVVLIILFSWSDANKQQASYACTLRRWDNKISEQMTGPYHDICMTAQGYRRVGQCYSGNLIDAPPFCFAPGWQFWRT